ERGPRPGRRERSWMSCSISGPPEGLDISIILILPYWRTSRRRGPRATFRAPRLASKWKFHAGRNGKSFGHLAHLLLQEFLALAAGIRMGGDDQILDDFRVFGLEQGWVDRETLKVALGGHGDGHHAGA